MWFIGVEVVQETSAPPPKKNPGSAPVSTDIFLADNKSVQFVFSYTRSAISEEKIEGL